MILLTLIVIVSFIASFILVAAGIRGLVSYNPDYDSAAKKKDAVINLVLAGIFLLFCHFAFWYIMYPYVNMIYNLNLPTL